MAKNYVGDDDVVQITSPSGGTTSTAGDQVAIATEGVFVLPKKSTTVLAAGAKVSWDTTHGYIDAPGTGLYPVGLALAAAGSGATTVNVLLDGISTAAA